MEIGGQPKLINLDASIKPSTIALQNGRRQGAGGKESKEERLKVEKKREESCIRCQRRDINI